MKIQDRLGQRIRALRENAGLSQKALAKKMKKAPQFVSAVEAGKNATLATVSLFADHLGVEPFSLFLFDSDESAPTWRDIQAALTKATPGQRAKLLRLIALFLEAEDGK